MAEESGGPVPTRAARPPERCGSCAEPIWKLAHVRTRNDAPIEVAAGPTGNITVDLEARTYTVLSGAALAAAHAAGRELHRNHFADCPQAARWHRRQPGRRGRARSPR